VTRIAYEPGLHELGDGLYAYLQPDGGWGWSNAGLITADGSSLLVDTLFDTRLTRRMLEEMSSVTQRHPIAQAFNTHGNGDHWFGNQLLPDGIPIVATAAALREMEAVPPSLAQSLFFELDLGPEFEAFAAQTFRRFEFAEIQPRLPTSSFSEAAELRVGDREVRLIELGPAHTEGDAIAWVPDAGVAFTGDLLFISGTPVMWAGTASRWLTACQRLLELEAHTLVPGHGPVTDASGVRDVQRYLSYVDREARARHEAGLDPDAAAEDIDIADFRDWGDPERLVVNVATVYRELDPSLPEPPVPELFVRMARWRARRCA
jgi:glyoxylase-like metal-dependent hydrolase (beta-lactamase superfamily II)